MIMLHLVIIVVMAWSELMVDICTDNMISALRTEDHMFSSREGKRSPVWWDSCGYILQVCRYMAVFDAVIRPIN